MKAVHQLVEVRAAAVGDRAEGIVIPFNGVLVTRELIERIGLPRGPSISSGATTTSTDCVRRAGARIATVACTGPAIRGLGH